MPHSIKVKIYYEDTDAGAVVYYANYLRYMERARTEFLAEKGIDIAGLHNEGLFFVVTHVDISYKRPARLGDIIEVTTEVMELKKASLIVRNRICKDNSVMVEAILTLACIDKDGRPKRLPEDFNALKGQQ
jgi:tol-pal system-associated acyl-CoA thioesterase